MSDDIGQCERDIRCRVERALFNGRMTRDDVGQLLESIAQEYKEPKK